MKGHGPQSRLARYPLLDALRERRSRRFGVGMEMKVGPLAHRSGRPAERLTEDEEALLAFAACGITGHAVADLVYAPGQGGTILAGLLGRTVASGDAIHTVSVFVINHESTFLLKRPRDFAPEEIPALADAARGGRFTELYRRSRVQIADCRVAPPLEPMFNLAVNEWSLYDEASTYFLPVNELTHLYINGVLEILDAPTAAFIIDERAGFRPAGLGRFARSKGGALHDDPRDERVLTIQQLESLVTEFVTIEQGMVMQNLGLMTQALGLGGFPHWAAHPFGWLEALGFETQRIPASRYLGLGPVLRLFARLLGRDLPVTHAVGLAPEGKPLLTPYCPPWYPSMADAVRAVVDHKFGPQGVFRGGARHSAWRDPEAVAAAAREPSEVAIEATTAYCDYVYRRYGRFPAYQPPFRTVLGYQAGHLDTEFYDRFYKPETLSETQRRHMENWHSDQG
jgi:hypothetical protein